MNKKKETKNKMIPVIKEKAEVPLVDRSIISTGEKAEMFLEEYEEILERPVKRINVSGSHVFIPKKHEGKTARIMIKRNHKEPRLIDYFKQKNKEEDNKTTN